MIAVQIVITDYENSRVTASIERYEQAPTEVEKKVMEKVELLFSLLAYESVE